MSEITLKTTSGGGLTLSSDEITGNYSITLPAANVTTTTAEALIGVTVVKIARSYGGFYAQTSDDKIYSWGYNINGQLGQGFTGGSELAAEVQFPVSTKGYSIVDFCANVSVVYVLWSNGELYSWGYNGEGELGLGDTTSRAQPTLTNTNVSNIYYVKTASDCHMDAAPSYQVFFLKKNNGTFWGCGHNQQGQLGIGNSTQQTSWVALVPPTGKTISTIWLSDQPNQSTFCKTTDNLIFACGYNPNGQLGLGNTSQYSSWQQVTFFDSISDVDDIQCGGFYYDGTTGTHYTSTVVKTTSGDIYTSGNNTNGQCGDGTTTQRTTFQKVILPKPVVKVIKNAFSCWVIFDDGTYSRWGYNNYGQLGTGSTSNAVTLPVNSTDTVVDIFAPTRAGRLTTVERTFLLKSSGLYFCGYNGYGAAGLGNVSINANVLTPTLVNINSLDIKQILGNGGGVESTVLCFNNSVKIMGCGYNANYEINNFPTSAKYSFRNLGVIPKSL